MQPHRQPLKLIVYNEDSREFQVTKEGAEFLSGIKQNLKVVCIVGPYRTGKSYLLNLFAGSEQGFKLGPTVFAETEGIWLWGEPIADGDGNVFVLLDTEGLGDTNRGLNYDVKIFALSVLLSSAILYNKTGTIDDRSITELSLVSEIAKMIQVSEGTNMQDKKDRLLNENKLFDFFPAFHFVVRDFTLQLKENDRPITSDEYLENCLKLKGTEHLDEDEMDKIVEITQNNTVKRNFRKVFPNRHCWVLPRPVDNEADLQHVDDFPFSSLKKGFQDGCNALISNLKTKTPLFKLKNPNQESVPISGPEFLGALNYYVKCINSGAIPVIERCFKDICDLANQSALQSAIQIYENHMSEKFSSLTFPLTMEELYQIHNEGVHMSIQELNKSGKGGAAILSPFLEKLKVEICVDGDVQENGFKIPKGGKFFQYFHKNKTFSEQFCKSIIDELCNDLYDKSVKGAVIQDAHQFEDAFHAIVASYTERAKGVASVEYKKILLDRINQIQQEFLMNKKLSKLEEERLAEQLKIEQQLQQISSLQEKMEEVEIQRKAEKVALDEEMRLLAEKHAKESQEIQARHQETINQLREEQKKFNEQNQQEMAEKYQQQIDMMKKSHSEEMQKMQAFFDQMQQQNNQAISVMEAGLKQLGEGIKVAQESSERAMREAIKAMQKKESGGGLLGKLVDIASNVANAWITKKLV